MVKLLGGMMWAQWRSNKQAGCYISSLLEVPWSVHDGVCPLDNVPLTFHTFFLRTVNAKRRHLMSDHVCLWKSNPVYGCFKLPDWSFANAPLHLTLNQLLLIMGNLYQLRYGSAPAKRWMLYKYLLVYYQKSIFTYYGLHSLMLIRKHHTDSRSFYFIFILE